MPDPVKPRFHSFPTALVTTAMTFLYGACLSFGGTANALEALHTRGVLDRAPTKETCIQWEMKLGLYKLTRQKEKTNDWMWIADHVVNKGVHKCLVVIGVRMGRIRDRGDLTLRLEDMEPLGIIPMRASNGELVEIEFEKILKATGGVPPLAIIKDQGSDLRCGGKRFCEAHPGVIDVHDVPHKIARLYGEILSEDDAWTHFTKTCSDVKKQLQLTGLANLAPPNQRSKARYHNIDVLVAWGLTSLSHCGAYKPLRWLKEYEAPLKEWEQLVATGKITRELIRKEGLRRDSHEVLEDRLLNTALCPKAEQLACDLIDFLEQEGGKVPQGELIIASSEVLESLFGLHKVVSARGPIPMGRLILSMASRVGEPPSESLITTALEEVTEEQVGEWLEQAYRGYV